ncbi:MAG: hypothetical protein K5751_01145 [Treponemataceae bacterium]|nr:hypothetical protein [Treponemataceae bacterium]
MKFLSEKDDVITAVLSKPAKATEQLQNKDNAVRIGDAPNGAAHTKVKIRKAGFSGASGASSSTTASGDIYRTKRLQVHKFFTENWSAPSLMTFSPPTFQLLSKTPS